jgi:hypothetical protein
LLNIEQQWFPEKAKKPKKIKKKGREFSCTGLQTPVEGWDDARRASPINKITKPLNTT